MISRVEESKIMFEDAAGADEVGGRSVPIVTGT